MSVITHVTNSDAQTSTFPTASTSTTIQVGTVLTAGSTIVVGVWSGTSGTTFGVSDNNSNGYVQDRFQAAATDGDSMAVWHADNIAISPNSQPTLTVTSTLSGIIRVVLSVYAGLPTSGTLVAVNSANATGTAVNSGNATPAESGDLAFGLCGNVGAPVTNIAAGSGYTRRNQVVDNTNARLANEDQIVPSAAALAATFTMDASKEWAAIIAIYKAITLDQLVSSNDIPNTGIYISKLDVGGY